GLGFDGTPGSQLPGIITSMFKQGAVSEPIIGLHLNSSSKTGELIFGDQYNSDFTWLPISVPNQWIFPVDSIQGSANNSTNAYICSGGCRALASTSYMSYGPRPEIIALYQAIGVKDLESAP